MARLAEAAILSFTELAEGGHRAYTEWHLYDHMPEEFSIEGIVAAERLVATPNLQAHFQVTDPAIAGTQYFGFYLVSQPVDETFEAIKQLGMAMAKQGRAGPEWAPKTELNPADDVVSTRDRRGPSAGYTVVGTQSAPTVASSPRVIPYRPHQGVHVVVRDPRIGAGGSVIDCGSDDILTMAGVAGCWTFRATNFGSITYSEPAPAGRVVHVYWLEGSPSAMASTLSARGFGEEDGYTTVFTGTYRVIPPDATYDWFDAS